MVTAIESERVEFCDTNYANERLRFFVFASVIASEYEQGDMLTHVQNYVNKRWPIWLLISNGQIAGYCCIKNPREHPETTTVIRPSKRRNGYSWKLRDYAIQDAINKKLIGGTVIYSGCECKNIASLKSLLHSGFYIVNMNPGDNFYNLRKCVELKPKDIIITRYITFPEPLEYVKIDFTIKGGINENASGSGCTVDAEAELSRILTEEIRKVIK